MGLYEETIGITLSLSFIDSRHCLASLYNEQWRTISANSIRTSPARSDKRREIDPHTCTCYMYITTSTTNITLCIKWIL